MPSSKRAKPSATLLALHADLKAFDAHLASLDVDYASLSGKRDELSAQLQAAQSSVLTEPDEFDEALIAAVVDQPNAPIDADAIARAADQIARSRAASNQRNASVNLYSTAIAKVDRDLAAIQSVRVEIGAQRLNAWAQFAREAYDHLLAGFESAFEKLCSDYLDPMAAMSNVRDDQGHSVIGLGDRRLSLFADELSLEYYPAQGHGRRKQVLLPRSDAWVRGGGLEDAVDRFRAGLE